MSDQTEPADQRPNEFREDEDSELAPLDEAPDGQTPSDATRSSEDSLPPGA